MKVLEVYPTTDRVDDALSQATELDARGVGGVFVRRAVTFRQLEQWLAASGGGARRRLSPVGRSLLLDRILRESDLPPFRAVATKGGFRRAVEGFLRDVALGGALPDELRGIAEKIGGSLTARLTALAEIAQSFAHRCSEFELVDPADALGEECRAIENGALEPAELASFDWIRVHDVVDWPPSRLAVIRAVARALERRGGRVEVILPRSASPELADVVEPAWQALESIPSGIELSTRPLNLPGSSRVRTFDAATEAMEARELAGRVRALLDLGTPPSEVVVAARDMASLAPALMREFEVRGIPVRHRRGRAAKDSWVVKIALELTRSSGPANASRERVGALVGSMMLDLRGIAPESPMPVQMVEHLRRARVRDRTDEAGTDGYSARLERLARACDAQGDDAGARQVRRTATALAAFFARVDRWPLRASLQRHGRELLQLLDDLRVASRLRRLGSAPQDARGTDAAAAALSHEQAAWLCLTEAVRMLSEGASSCGRSDEAFSRAEFAGWLETALGTEAIRPGSARGVAVELVELSDVAGRRLEHLFIAGAHEARLPGPPEPDALFTEDDRWRMNHALGRAVFRVAPRGMERTPFPSRQLLHGVSFALALEAAAQVTISRPRADSRGRPLAPSPFLALTAAGESESLRFEALDARHRRSEPHIDERAFAETERLQFFEDARGSAYAGTVPGSPALEGVVPGSAEKPLSASALERAANCRFRYFAENILGATPPPDDEQDAGPLESGKLAHLAAETAVRAILDAGAWSRARQSEAVAIGLDAARAAVNAAERDSVLGDPAVWAVAREKMFARLARLLALELERATSDDMVPLGLEIGFGREAALPALHIGELFVTGKIDRVDRGPAGALVLDYKSGSSDANARKLRKDALLVTQFQLPIYMLAAQRLLGAGPAVDAAYVSLRDGERSKTVLAVAKTSAEELAESLEAAVTKVISAMRRGDFEPTPVSCAGCHVRPICRIPRPEVAP